MQALRIHQKLLKQIIMNNKDQILRKRFSKQNMGNKAIGEGKIVQRYNIAKAMIEFYFIPSEKLEDYEMAKSRQDLNANRMYGRQM